MAIALLILNGDLLILKVTRLFLRYIQTCNLWMIKFILNMEAKRVFYC